VVIVVVLSAFFSAGMSTFLILDGAQ